MKPARWVIVTFYEKCSNCPRFVRPGTQALGMCMECRLAAMHAESNKER